MTKVLLGLCDQSSVATDTDWSSNKMGGKPDWIKGDLFSQVICETCKGQVIFVGQLYCPVEEINRVLYLFLCTNTSCITSCRSWTIIRCQGNIERSIAPVGKSEFKSVFEFDSDFQDWSSDDDTFDTLISKKNVSNLKSMAIEEKSELISCKEEGTPLENAMESLIIQSKETTFKPFFIYVHDEEDVSANDSLEYEQKLIEKYLRQENVSLDDLLEGTPAKGKKSQKESYEKFNISYMSQNQKKFFQEVKKCPDQILRYSYGGHPLIYGASQNLPKVPNCSCGSSRIFEVQVMPAIGNYRTTNISMPESSLEGLDIGSVYIFTCSSHCWREGIDSIKYEYAVIERDDLCKKDANLKKAGRYKI